MTKEEFYIWLLESESEHELDLKIVTSHNFNPEFLKNYEIAKLFLEKFKIHNLSEIQQRNLNPEAVLAWFRVSKFIHLQYNIPEILELLPERIVGNLYLRNSEIQSLPELKEVKGWICMCDSQIQFLPNLEIVRGHICLGFSRIESFPKLRIIEGTLKLMNSRVEYLPELESVGGSLDLRNCQIKYLPKLKYVGGDLRLQRSKIESLPELNSVGGSIFVDGSKLRYWRNYFRETERPTLTERIVIT